MGGAAGMSQIIRRELDDSQCQMMFTSTTSDNKTKKFGEEMVPNPVLVILREEDKTLTHVKQYYVDCENRDAKYAALVSMSRIPTIGQTVVICDTNETVCWLYEKYTSDQQSRLTFRMLSGQLSLEDNILILNQFRQKQVETLIITDFFARAFEIEQRDTVINFDLPMDKDGEADCETYLQRVGRISMFMKTSYAINLVEGLQSKNALAKIEKHCDKKICCLNTNDLSEMEKQLID